VSLRNDYWRYRNPRKSLSPRSDDAVPHLDGWKAVGRPFRRIGFLPL